MKLTSTLREKRHYVIIKSMDVTKLKNILLDYLGIINYAKAGPKLIKLNDKIAISIERDFVNIVKVALSLSNIKVLFVSGTLKKAKA